VKRHPYVVDVLREFVGRPFVFAIEVCDVETTDQIAVEGSLVFLNNSIMAVYSHPAMIMRDRKSKDFLVKLFLTLYISEKFDNSSYGNSHTMSVLPVRNVK